MFRKIAKSNRELFLNATCIKVNIHSNLICKRLKTIHTALKKTNRWSSSNLNLRQFGSRRTKGSFHLFPYTTSPHLGLFQLPHLHQCTYKLWLCEFMRGRYSQLEEGSPSWSEANAPESLPTVSVVGEALAASKHDRTEQQRAAAMPAHCLFPPASLAY